MEHSIETLPEWKPYLAHLRQICKILGDPLIKEVLLEKAFGTASPYERKQIHRFNLKIADCRWEYLEDIVVRLLEIIPWLSQRKAVLPGIFPTDRSMVERVVEALEDESFLPLTAVLALFLKAIGHEASWFDGCYCHEVILTTSCTFRERQREMLKVTGAATCPWKRKRLASMTMGRGREICDRVKHARSAQTVDVMLAAPAHVAS